MRLEDGDWIVAAWPENASGPGWANSYTKVLVQSRSGALRIEWIQRDDYDRDLSLAHDFSAAVCGRFREIAEMRLRKLAKRRVAR